MPKLVIYTDGACSGNPGPGGWGAVIVTPHRVVELAGHDARTTNNRMEMHAAYEALLYAAEQEKLPITLHTDSSYVINGITKWVVGWESRGWLTAQKQEVANKDLWQKLVAAHEMLGGRVTWKYVGGHIG